jgi:hypothetical protein
LPERVDIIAIYDNKDFSAPIEYTLELFFSIYGVSYRIMPLHQFKPGEHNLDATLVISYGEKYLDTGAKKQIHVYASDFFGKDYLKANSMPKTPLKKYGDLAVIYAGHNKFDGWIQKSEGQIATNIDIVASSFFMLSRYEEVVIKVKDQHGRFPVTASLAHKEGFLDRPIVNEYIWLLWDWISSLKPELTKRAPWPGNKDFAVCLTHDVDFVRRYTLLPTALRIGSILLRQRDLRLAFNIAIDYLATLLRFRKDPLGASDYIVDLERGYGFKSSFYFMAGGESQFDNRYPLTESKVAATIKAISRKGAEVGLHASYNSHDNLDIMVSEKTEMDKLTGTKSYGCRQHYLRWKTPDTWQIQEKAGFLYDSSLSFSGSAGFRCGLCLPFQPFDIIQNRKLNIWELPLIVTDTSLRKTSCQSLPPEVAYKKILEHYLETARKFNGVFVLLWHSSSFDSPGDWAGWKELYKELMEGISQQNAFVDSCRAIVEWWQETAKA